MYQHFSHREASKPVALRDVRQIKTRARLTASTMALALESGCMDLEIAHVARRARVNRSTFYAHAPSTSVLLEGMLGDELRELCDEYLAQPRNTGIGQMRVRDAGETSRLLAVATLHHVEIHAELYQLMLTDDACGARLRSLLSGVLSEAIRKIDWGVSAPERFRTSLRASVLFHSAAPAFVAAGMVATISSWLASPRRDHGTYFTTLRFLLPAWWPLNTQPV